MKIGKNKGYTANEYYWGFWLWIIGIIVVACKPEKRQNNYSNSLLNERELLNKYFVEEAREYLLKNGVTEQKAEENSKQKNSKRNPA